MSYNAVLHSNAFRIRARVDTRSSAHIGITPLIWPSFSSSVPLLPDVNMSLWEWETERTRYDLRFYYQAISDVQVCGLVYSPILFQRNQHHLLRSTNSIFKVFIASWVIEKHARLSTRSWSCIEWWRNGRSLQFQIPSCGFHSTTITV